MKLRHRYSKLAYYKRIGKRSIRAIRWALSLRPGDLINDCTGFNTYILNVEPFKIYTRQGWYIVNVDFETSTVWPADEQNGGCSLLNCGVTPPIPREVCEADYLKFLNHYLTEKGSGSAEHWYGGLDNPEHKEQIERLFRTWDILKSGGHVADEKGVLMDHKNGHL